MAAPFVAFYFPLLGTPTAEGNQLTFYEAGLDVPLNVYTDVDGLIPWAQPIVLNAAAEADGVIYVDPDGPSLKVVYIDPTGVAIPGYPVDFIPPGGIINVMTTSITTLTNAQIKALPTTPITFVSAPASGLMARILGITLRLDSAAGAYTNLNAAGSINFTGFVGTPIQNDVTSGATALTDFLGVASTRTLFVPVPYMEAPGSVVNTFNTTTSTYDGQAIHIIGDNNSAGDWTGGNVANSMTVVCYYALESLA